MITPRRRTTSRHTVARPRVKPYSDAGLFWPFWRTVPWLSQRHWFEFSFLTCSLTFLTRPTSWFVCNLDQATYLPTYLPIYGKTLQNYFHIWVDPQVPTYLTYLPTYHPTSWPYS